MKYYIHIFTGSFVGAMRLFLALMVEPSRAAFRALLQVVEDFDRETDERLGR